MKRITVAYIGGGSKNWAQKYFADFLLQDKLEGEIRLFDLNLESADLNKRYFERMVKDNPDKVVTKWKCTVVPDIDDALKGADLVLISILPYSLDNMKIDVHYPEKYGIYQSVGDTVGPGGYSRALRTLGTFRYFAERIKANCPGAWVINYTNPLDMCVNMLYRAFPEIKAFGCCHEVFGFQKLAAAITGMYNSLSEEGKKAFMSGDLFAVRAECFKQGKNFDNVYCWKGIERHGIITNVQGINHFTVVDNATYLGKDIMPVIKAYAALFRKRNLKRLGKLVPGHIKRFRNHENVKYAILERYGVAGAAGARHLAEFLPEEFLPIGKRNVLASGFGLTPVWGRIIYDNFLRITLKLGILKPGKLAIKASGEEGVSQVTALMGLKELTTNVNVINRGQAPDLPMGTAVESNARFLPGNIEPLNAGPIKNAELLAIERLHASNQKDYVEAYYNKDKAGLLTVFLRDPSVARLGAETGTKLFNEMIQANSEVLEDWIIK